MTAPIACYICQLAGSCECARARSLGACLPAEAALPMCLCAASEPPGVAVPVTDEPQCLAPCVAEDGAVGRMLCANGHRWSATDPRDREVLGACYGDALAHEAAEKRRRARRRVVAIGGGVSLLLVAGGAR